ncbi:class I SAM-dependent methyltransferase [Protaetiibacter intestinalis]|uniref:Demethylmenaquinone methyltransferase n=2 Tax=Protaetiibacter intestinalis TaxID=2419774 RepID=A0A387B3C3_9MICO|nr:class I SAM-dependent methyltransferase [Protaetiibacter intestinalis]
MEKRPDEVSGMFSDVARGYDRTNDLLSVGNAILWRIATVKAIDPQPGERILDVAAGTGTSSAAIARSGATVVAVDFSPGMIAEGRRRQPSIEFVEADAMRLPFGDEEFDAVTISFGLRNIADPIVALGEMYRVLKPGGRLVVCEFSHPTNPVMRLGYETYLKLALPLVAKLSSTNPDAYSYLVESIQQWPDQQALSHRIRGVGFTRVAHRNLTGGVVALHRGRKPVDEAVRASAARRRAPRKTTT